MNKLLIIIIIGSVITVIILLAVLMFARITGKSPLGLPILPSITPIESNIIPITNAPKSTLLIPTAPLEQGGGVNVSAPTVEASTQEIKKITGLLPQTFQKTLTTGLPVDIFISIPDVSRPWVLPIFIGGIDYQVPENSPKYAVMRNSFREAAKETFKALSESGVDTSKLFINWGDQAFIQERAEKWLQ